MKLFLDACWRALLYCLRPRVIALSILPLLLMIALTAGLLFLFWESAVAYAQSWLNQQALLADVLRWLTEFGGERLRAVLAPLLVLMLALPLIIVLTLLAVSWLMTPALVALVAEKRFPALARQRGGSIWRSMLLGLGSALLAALALALSLPLWLIPPLVMVLPPLIWGWLSYRIMVYDVLAEHASHAERVVIVRRYRPWLIGIGVLTGYLGAAPGAIWTVGAMAVVLAPLLVPVAIWIYTFVFAFSALWFTHFCLAALAALRAETAPAPALPAVAPPSEDPDDAPVT